MHGLNFIFILFYCYSSATLFAAQRDTLQAKNTIHAKTLRNKVDYLNKLCALYLDSNTDKALEYASEAKALAEQLNYPQGKALSCLNLGTIFSDKNNFRALQYFIAALSIYEDAGDSAGIALVFHGMGSFYINQNEYKNAMEYHQKALRIKEMLKDKWGISGSYNCIGNIYAARGNYTIALNYYLKSLKIREAVSDTSNEVKYALAINYRNLGRINAVLGNNALCLEYYFKSFEISARLHDKRGTAVTLCDIGNIYHNLSDDSLALKYTLEAMRLAEENELTGEMITICGTLSAIYYEKGNRSENPKNYEMALMYANKILQISRQLSYKNGMTQGHILAGKVLAKQKLYGEALRHFKEVIVLIKETGIIMNLRQAYETMFTIYKQQNNFKKALEYHELLAAMKDSILSSEVSRKVTQMISQYQSDKEKRIREIMAKAREEKQNDELRRQRILRNSFIIGFILVCLLVLVIFQAYRQKKKSNIALAEAYHLIEQKSIQINDSIHYAFTIQEAILPSKAAIQKHFEDWFILYKPKDVVSGDFYWTYAIPAVDGELSALPFGGRGAGGGVLLMAAVDCAGHGVPGAIMSMLGYSLLQNIVKSHEFTHPAAILDNLHAEVEIILKRENEKTSLLGGMDIALISLEYNSNIEPLTSNIKLQYAGARNPLWIIRRGEIIEIKGNKRSIGIPLPIKSDSGFTNHIIELYKDDQIYIFSDGYADQMGGQERKKFYSQKLKELLLSMHNEKMETQKKRLDEEITLWKGGRVQTDDILVMGMKI